MVITNGFTYLAVLMFIAGGLLALQKYAKWKVFNVVPPLVWIYVLNMIFCTAGLYSSDACSAAYSALKNNILYAMIFAGKTVRPYDCYLPGMLLYHRYWIYHRLSDFQRIPRCRYLGCYRSALCFLGRRKCQHGCYAGCTAG